jgi:predicted Zn-dependent protease
MTPTRSRASRFRLPVLLLAATLGACATVPETGRQQLLLISSSEEMQLGLTEFEKIKKNTPISKDAAATALVQKVGRRIAAVAPLPNAQWEFVLFDEPKTPNAFCLPGGKVGVSSGILPITRDETGLAIVIGHEVAHAVARHGGERVSQGLMLQLGGQALSAATHGQPAATRNLILGAYGIGAQVGVMLPHSREQELEADRIGLIYMARAGYDPREAVAFWQRFQAYNEQHGGGKTFAFLSTHPLDDVRIERIRALLPQAMAEYQKAK